MKNAILYRITAATSAIAVEQLTEALSKHPPRDLADQETRQLGFVPPLPGDELALELSGFVALAIRFTERKVPTAAVKTRVERIASEEEKSTGMRVPRARKVQIKEQVLEEMIPGIPPTVTRVSAYIDRRRHLIVVDASSPTRAESLLDHLRLALGSLKVVPLAAKKTPRTVMTGWMLEDEAPGFEIGDRAKLASTDGETVSFSGIDLSSHPVHEHLQSGLRCRELALKVDEVAKFTLRDDLRLAGIKFDDTLLEAAAEDAEDAEAAAHGTFVAEAGAFSEILIHLDQYLDLSLGEPLAAEAEEGDYA